MTVNSARRLLTVCLALGLVWSFSSGCGGEDTDTTSQALESFEDDVTPPDGTDNPGECQATCKLDRAHQGDCHKEGMQQGDRQGDCHN